MDNKKMVVHVFDKNANLYQEKYMNVDLYGDTLDVFCEHIEKENAGILEIGCGPGNVTRYLLNKRPDFNILGIDLAPNMIELAKINNPEAVFQIMDARDIATQDKKYDGVMCGFCLPYLSKEESIQLIHDASTLLNPGGALYISTMEDDYSNSRLQRASTGDEVFMYFHQADYLMEALLENGLQVIDIQRKKYTGQDGTMTTDLVIVAGK